MLVRLPHGTPPGCTVASRCGISLALVRSTASNAPPARAALWTPPAPWRNDSAPHRRTSARSPAGSASLSPCTAALLSSAHVSNVLGEAGSGGQARTPQAASQYGVLAGDNPAARQSRTVASPYASVQMTCLPQPHQTAKLAGVPADCFGSAWCACLVPCTAAQHLADP
eukprot:1185850-Prorocentrum_minimum.AAC.1